MAEKEDGKTTPVRCAECNDTGEIFRKITTPTGITVDWIQEDCHACDAGLPYPKMSDNQAEE